MILNENYTLNNGYSIPKIAFGTWQISDEDTEDAVALAIKNGYRLIDTAVQYENEEGVGRGIQKSGIDRAELFISTKIPHDIKTYEGAKQSIVDSLCRIGTDYIDLMLIHSPKPWPELFAGSEKTYFEENLAVWKAMEEALADGKVKAIGVSNFEIADIQNIIDNADVKPAVNQVRVHIGHVPYDVLAYCNEQDIRIMAFSPNATGKLKGNQTIAEMAAKYGVSIPRLAIRFDVQLGVVPLPKTVHEEYMIQNADVDFVISDEDMATLKAVEEIQSLE